MEIIDQSSTFVMFFLSITLFYNVSIMADNELRLPLEMHLKILSLSLREVDLLLSCHRKKTGFRASV